MVKIKNGGLEAGLLAAVAEDRELSNREQARLSYLNGLPRNEFVPLDQDGMAITAEQAEGQAAGYLSRFKPK